MKIIGIQHWFEGVGLEELKIIFPFGVKFVQQFYTRLHIYILQAYSAYWAHVRCETGSFVKQNNGISRPKCYRSCIIILRVCLYNCFCRKVAKIESINREAVNDPEHYLGHPVNGYLLVKRFLWEWAEIENNVRLDKPKTGRWGCVGIIAVQTWMYTVCTR